MSGSSAPSPPPPSGRRSFPDFSDLAVLVVDDYADSRELLRAIFEQCAAAVIDAATIAEARQYVETVSVDLIVTDLALPTDRKSVV